MSTAHELTPSGASEPASGSTWRAGLEHVAPEKSIYERAARDYNHMAGIMGLGTGNWYRRQALRRAGLQRGMRVLDVGFGTGLLAAPAIALIGDAALLTGIDPSSAMLRASALAGRVTLLQARAEQLPLRNTCADFVSMGYALRHLCDAGAAFAEFHRVLRPGGRVCVLEISKPGNALGTATLRAYMRHWMPLASRLSGAARHTSDVAAMWRHCWDTVEHCLAPERVMQLLREAGFEHVQHIMELGCFAQYIARKPE